MTLKPDERGEDRGRHARRRWREVFDNLLPVIVAAIVAILAILVVLSVAVFHNASSASSAAATARASVERQRLTALNGCERVQLVRDDVNVTAWGVYNALALAQDGPSPARIRRLLAAVDPDTQALLGALLASGAQGRATYLRIKDEQRYLPPTDCDRASRNPRYRFPQPIPFRDVIACYDPDRNPRPEKPCRRR